METTIIGAVCHINLNYQLMKEAGITWLRHPFTYPFEEDGVTLREQYLRQKEEARHLIENGFKLLGTTFGIGSYRYIPEEKVTRWSNGTPAYVGKWNEERYYENCAKAAAFMAEDLKDLITWWQISNEPDIETFHGDMTEPQIERFLNVVARGLKKGNPSAQPGTNLAGISPFALELARHLCTGDDPAFEYIGIDGYLGSWSEGGPDEWRTRLDVLWSAARKPIIVIEWGYATLESGPNPDPEHKRFYNQDVCKNKTWGKHQHWDNKPHSNETQAEFIMQTMKIFHDHPAVIGEFFLRWSDTETCWQCGDPLCPSECAWGIVDVNGRPKAGYYALKAAYEKYYQ